MTGWYPYDKFSLGDGDDIGFYEEDEYPKKVLKAFDEGEKGITEAPLNTDELIEKMQADELEDDDSPLITPVNYSKIRPFSSQQIFYHIRSHHLKVYVCQCGRRCINKQEADTYFRSAGKLSDGQEG